MTVNSFQNMQKLIYLHYYLSTLSGWNQTLTNNAVKESSSKMPVILII